ncbi:YegP family protein [Pseudomonas sp. NPDC078416]|uniref:YegP family protein n=1 Tax=Pseudomonas sp. NPDC078416 TaxID=3390637 RepID=UPI003CFD5E97
MAQVTYPCYWQKKDSSGQWYWIYYASNGKAIARSSESYVARADCERSVEILQASSTSAVFYDS